MDIFFLLTIIAILLTSVGQVLLKIGSGHQQSFRWGINLHPASLAAYLLFTFIALVSIFALRGMELKVFFALNALTYICVLVLSSLFLHERITRNGCIAVFLITLGVWIFIL